ncbi:branched-chain amino acid ABC transporter permease [Halovivax gelatinilyticus]|uniref:branched-chain amino acid ABC transporter permease n=1 Tax=Halovivax gelatinilyticus TaxID=2961597 RepID=UPI0020CA2D9D|nr:branched-chain amino acid ABC transporter permease [Halovivax gelatinilyticus]
MTDETPASGPDESDPSRETPSTSPASDSRTERAGWGPLERVHEALDPYADIALGVLILAILPQLIVEAGTTYQARLLTLFLTFALFVVALNIVFGHTDQLFLFVGALAGIGAYTTALLAEAVGVSAWLFLPVGGLAAGLLGMLVSYISARRGMTVIVIAILTLSLQLAIMEFFVGARTITEGSTGFFFADLELTLLTETVGFERYVAHYYVLLAFLAALLILYRTLMTSKYGLAFTAIRQDEVAAESIGIDVVWYKTMAGFLAAMCIGLVGPLYAHGEGWIEPSMFAFDTIDVLVLIMLVIGGMRTTWGPIVGAGVIIYLEEQLHAAGQWRMSILGLLLIVLFLYFREGIVPKTRELRESDVWTRGLPAIVDRFR